MRIEELYLAGFGRFYQQRIVLKDGLNLIFGENEAGKTTLQHFILGMLYGFFVPGAKRKTYTDDYTRYIPWRSDSSYGGTMICSKDGKRYRIQRVFQKEREQVTIFDADSGEDISEQFPYDPVTRLREPGPQLCGVSRTVFCNTANVGQMEIALQGDFSAAWEDQILSFMETADSSLSLQQLLGALDQKAEEIGSPKRRKSPYGQVEEQLEQLELEWQEAKKAEERCTRLREEIHVLEENKNSMEQQMQQQEQNKWKQQFEKATRIQQRIQQIQEQKNNEEESYDPDELQQKIGAYQQAKQNLEREERGFLKWEGRLKEINQRYLAQPIRMQDITVLDRCLLLAKNSVFSSETQQLKEQLQKKQQEFIAIPHIGSSDAWEALVEYESWQEDIDQTGVSGKSMVCAAGFVLVVAAAAMGYLLDPFFYAGTLVGVILLLCSLFLNSKKKELREAKQEQQRILEQYNMNSYEQLKEHCRLLQQREDQRVELMNEIQLLALRLEKISEDNPQRKVELDRFAARLTRDPSARWSQAMEQQVKNARALCLEFEEMAQQREEEAEKLSQRQQEVAAMEQEIQEILTQIGADSLNEDALQKLREQRRAKEQAETELELQQQLLKECLGHLTYEELQQKIQLVEKTEEQSLQTTDLDYRSLVEQLAKLQGQLATLEQLQRPLGEIQEEQLALQESRRNYQKQLQALALAKEHLQQAGSRIRNDLTPQLSEKLSQQIETLTEGRYHRVLLSHDMHIRLEEAESRQLVPLTAVSRGAADLIYLSARLELLRVLAKNTELPLLLDDSFVQLDDRRCAALLSYLAKKQTGQVLLFTCQSREERILKKENIPYQAFYL